MPRQQGGCYDPLTYYTRRELQQMLQAEGCSHGEAKLRAEELYWEIINCNLRERYSWSKARSLEVIFGVGKAIHELSGHYVNAEDLWFEIESQCLPGQRELTHYEKLRGCKRIRLTPEEKEDRALTRKRQRDIRKRMDIADLWRRYYGLATKFR
jgi:hypothetical protein